MFLRLQRRKGTVVEAPAGTTIAERVARNQATFRDANERIEQAADGMVDLADPLPFICECARRNCTELTRLTREEYEGVRKDARQFFVARGHEICEVDGVVVATMVDRRERYTVLRKVGEAGQVAEDLDPRGPNLDG
jgi:hypothetical protein